MKKRDKKLQLCRETVLHLDPRHVKTEDLVKARGAAGFEVVQEWSSCGAPDCC